MKVNSQPIEKQVGGIVNPNILDVVEIFYTIQGEGPFNGEPAIFIRLAGCNLQCPGCDTDYTSDRYESDLTSIINNVIDVRGCCKADLVVITGGEPFRQHFGDLVKKLVEYDFRVQVETNGTLFLQNFPYDLCTIVCSPKAGTINKKLLPHITALKYVLSSEHVDPDDGLPTMVLYHPSKRVARPPKNFTGEIFVQPMDQQDPILNAQNLRATVESAMIHGYRVCLQVHKILNME